jgi:hypothetical protein
MTRRQKHSIPVWMQVVEIGPWDWDLTDGCMPVPS